MNLSKLKQKSLNEKVLARIDHINFLKEQPTFNPIELNSEFKNLSFVWRIFLLHIIKPTEIPMYDQNVHRAYHFVFGKDYQSISELISDKQKEDFYFGEYYPFISSIEGFELRKIDRAFFAFGQFLRNQLFPGMLK